MPSTSSTPERPEVVPPSMGRVWPAPLGVPSQDPREQAQVRIPADEARRERLSALVGGGVVAGVIVGGALGTAVGGPVGTLVGATLGAAAGATVALALRRKADGAHD
jgi:uncharacterized protein YcfJ